MRRHGVFEDTLKKSIVVNVEGGPAGTDTDCLWENARRAHSPVCYGTTGERHNQRKEHLVGDSLSVACHHKYTYIWETLANLECMLAANIVIGNSQISVGLKQ